MPKNGLPFQLRDAGLTLNDVVIPLTSSDGYGWPNLNVSVLGGLPYDSELTHQTSSLWLIMPLQPLDMSFVAGATVLDGVVHPRQILVVAPHALVTTRRRNAASALHVLVREEVVSEVATELFDHGAEGMRIATTPNVDDPGLTGLMCLLEQALYAPAEHPAMEVEYLTRGLVADVLTKCSCSSGGPPAERTRGGLTAGQIGRVTDYIRERLSSTISLNDLAISAGMSRAIFIQRFRVSFGQTPYQYVVACRVSRAQELLAKTALPLMQIALNCGFSDQAHFNVRFKRATGTTPSAYRHKTGREQ
jgi:AraC family transcriptional regulator